MELETNRDGGSELSELKQELIQVVNQFGQIEGGIQVVKDHMSALESRQTGL